MKTIKKTLTYCLATSLMATSLNAFAAASNDQNLMNMGPNQLMSAGKQILWKSAYRIDKELIAQSESHSSYESNYDTSSSTVAGGTSPFKIFAGSVLGGILAGTVGPSFGIGAKLASAGGAAIGAGLTMEPQSNSSSNSNSNTSYSSDSSSQTYAVHEKANTWAIIALDKDAYLAARDQLSKSTVFANSSCSQQGRDFLDEVIANYHVASANDLKNLATIVDQLSVKKSALDAAADQQGTTSALSDKIDEFNAQRVRVIRINWKSLVTRSGDCSSANDLAQSIQQNANSLYSDLKKSSVIEDANSMALISKVTFEALPDQNALTANQAAILKASQARLVIDQAQTLQALENGNYIEIRDGRILAKNNLAQLNAGLAKREALQKATANRVSSAGVTAVALTMTGMLTTVGAFVVFSTENNADILSERMISGGVGSMVSAIGVAALIGHNTDKETSESTLQKTQAVVAQDANLNKLLNKIISTNETIYSLDSNQTYMANRNKFISDFKANVAYQLTIHQGSLARTYDDQYYNDLTNYPYYLIRAGVLSGEQVQQMRNIFDVMKGNKIEVSGINSALMQEQQIAGMSAVVKQMMADSKDDAQKAKLQKLADNLDREQQVLDLVK